MQNIDEVITSLRKIVDQCYEQGSRQGYFASLYYHMTVAVKNGITENTFEDAIRMERLDVNFATRYIAAYEGYQGGKKIPQSWQCAFDACRQNNLVVIQHLILGINSHINFDLGMAAALTAPGHAVFDLHNDFEQINNVIGRLADDVQARLAQVWWPMKYLGRLTNGKEKAVLNFSIEKARKAAWANAVALAQASPEAADNYLVGLDKAVVKVAQKVIAPGWLSGTLLWPVRQMEPRSVKEIIELLSAPLEEQ